MVKFDINELKASDFYGLPILDKSKDVLVESLVLLPYDLLHDSGYKMFDVVAIDSFNYLLGVCDLYDCFDISDFKDCKIDLLKCGLFRIQFSEPCYLNAIFHTVKGGKK